MIKKILIGLAVIVLLFLVVVAFQPAEYQVKRSATISAPPAVVFDQVNDFHKWEGWSPWAKLDPAVKNTFEGPPAGTGAIFSWVGNKDVGEGRMTLTESHTNDLVKINLEFIKPFASVALTEFAFKPAGNQTAVTWTMSGHNNFMGKAMCLFMNMDKMVGGDFEKGLAQMKSVAEKASQK
jgi:hypothetical protein